MVCINLYMYMISEMRYRVNGIWYIVHGIEKFPQVRGSNIDRKYLHSCYCRHLQKRPRTYGTATSKTACLRCVGFAS